MLNHHKKKLTLRKETLRSIATRDLAAVVGGTLLNPEHVAGPAPAGFIMKDSIIVRTSTR